MERSTPLSLTAGERPILTSVYRKMREMARGCLSKRHASKVLDDLSNEQLRDCGIDAIEHNVATLEVPTGLMQRLMAMR